VPPPFVKEELEIYGISFCVRSAAPERLCHKGIATRTFPRHAKHAPAPRGLRRKEGFFFVCFPAVKTAGYYQSSPAGTGTQRRYAGMCARARLIPCRYARVVQDKLWAQEGLSALRYRCARPAARGELHRLSAAEKSQSVPPTPSISRKALASAVPLMLA
jgi:hypothetical protein